MRSPLIGGFCAGVTMATASSWLTKFVGAMAVNMVIVLLIRERGMRFLQYLHHANNNKGCCSRSMILKRILCIFHFIEIFRSLRFMLGKGFFVNYVLGFMALILLRGGE